MPIVAPRIEMPPIGYSNYGRPVTERPLRNGTAVLPEREKILPKYVMPSINREEVLQSIAFLTQYMEDLKNGKPVDNISPSNDPYYLVPENIADMIEDEQYLLNGGKFRRINNIEDIIG